MSKIVQYSRLSHHTISGTGSTGVTFSIPASEDFTDGSWLPIDLALSEIGVNEEDKKVYIRIDDEIKEFQLYGSTGSGDTLSQVLSVGNTTGGTDIEVSGGDKIYSASDLILQGVDSISSRVLTVDKINSIVSNTQSSRIQSEDYNNGYYSFLSMKSDEAWIFMDNGNVSPYIKMSYDFSVVEEGVIDINPSGTLNISNNRLGMNVGVNNLSNAVGGVHYNISEVATSNNTTTVVSTIEFSSEVDSIITVDVIVNGYDLVSDKAYGSKLFGVFKNSGGTTTLISSVDVNEKTSFSTVTSNLGISSNDVVITVTGETAHNINWVVRYNYMISK